MVALILLRYVVRRAESSQASCSTALPAVTCPRYYELRQKLSAAIIAKFETENGQSWDLSESQITFTETAEWTEMERLCRPFLKFNLETGNEPGLRLNHEFET